MNSSICLKLIGILLICFYNLNIYAQFAFSLGSNDFEAGIDIAIDNQGNTFVIGNFKKTIDFDPSPGVFELINNSVFNDDIFVASFDTDGNLRFAFSIGSPEDYAERARGISLDDDGNVYITGQFNGVVDFDPSTDVFEVVSNDVFAGNGFVASYSNLGDFRFAFSIGSSGFLPQFDQLDIKLDDLGNSYISGLFSGTIDFDPSPSVNELSIGNLDVSTFLVSYDNNGEFRFVFDLGYFRNSLVSFSLAVDGDGNSYLLGRFGGTVDFDPGLDTFELSSELFDVDVFVASYYTDGTFRSAFKIDTNVESHFPSLRISLDSEQNIYITGTFLETADFDPDSSVFELTTIIWSDLFLASYTNNGSLRFAFTIGNEQTVFDTIKVAIPTDIVVDNLGNSYITGGFNGTIDFDPGSNVFELVNDFNGGSDNDFDIFIASYTDEGDFRFASRIGSLTQNDGSGRVTVDNELNSCITGDIRGNIEFNQTTGMYEVVGGFSSPNILVACYSSDGTLVGTDEEFLNKTINVQVFPNPTSQKVSIKMDKAIGTSKVDLVNINGQIILHTLMNESIEIDVSKLPKGYYVLTIVNDSKKIRKPIIIN